MKIQKYLQFTILTQFIFLFIFFFSINAVYADPHTNGGMPIVNGGQTGTPVNGGQTGTPANGGQTGTSAQFENPLGYETVEGLLGSFLKVIQGIVATLAVLMIVVGGVLYMTSAGDQGRVETAKKAVTGAVIGLALALAAPAFLQQIYTIMGATAPNSAPIAEKSLSEIILNTLNVLLSIIGTLAILMLVVGGIMYMTSAGDDARAETAKKTIQYAIIGLIVAIISLIIVTQINNLFI